MTPDPLALALRELRNSPNTEAAGWRDAADANALRAILARLGLGLVPTELDEAMRAAIWRAQAAQLLITPQTRETYARARVENVAQHELDRVAWAALHAEAAARFLAAPEAAHGPG